MSILVLNLTNYLYEFERNVADDIFLPPPEGIYQLGILEPIVKANQTLYVKSSGMLVDVVDNIKDDLVDSDGNVLIVKYVLERASKLLSNKPFIDYRRIKVLRLLARHYLNEGLAYVPGVPTLDDIAKELAEHIDPNVVDLAIKDGILLKASETLCKDISTFIADDNWHIHYMTTESTQVMIEKSIDYRIADWTKRMRSGEWKW